jgi:hypothetical protein
MNEEGKSRESETSRIRKPDPRDLQGADCRRQTPVQLLATAGVVLVVLFQICVMVGLWIADIRRLPEIVSDEPEIVPEADVASLEPAVPDPATAESIPEPAPEEDEPIVTEPAPSRAEDDQIVAMEPEPVAPAEVEEVIVPEITAVTPEVAAETPVEIEAPVEEAPPQEPPPVDLLVLARQEAEAGRLEEAEEFVRREMEQSPDRIEAHLALAQVLELLSRYEESLAAWDDISDRSADAEVLSRVSAERIRIGELIFANREAVEVESPAEEIPVPLEMEPEPPPVVEVVKTPDPPAEMQVAMVEKPEPPSVTPDPPPVEEQDDAPRISSPNDPVPRFSAEKKPDDSPPAEKRPVAVVEEPVALVKIERSEVPTPVPVRDEQEPARDLRIQIVDVDPPKVRDRDDDQFEEIRSIQVRIRRRKSAGAIDWKSVAVGLEFFDQNETTGAIVRSEITPKITLKLKSEWPTIEEERTLTYLYQVPNGSRVREFRDTNQKLAFYGFVVKVQYNRDFQDEKSWPESLLSKSRDLL